MKPDNLTAWLSIVAAILATGMYVGRLEQRITSLEAEGRFLHGSFTVPKEGVR